MAISYRAVVYARVLEIKINKIICNKIQVTIFKTKNARGEEIGRGRREKGKDYTEKTVL